MILLLLFLFLLVSDSLVFYCSLVLGGQLLLGPPGRVSHGRLGGSLLVSFLYGHGRPLSQTLSSLVWHDGHLGDHSHDGIALAQSTIPESILPLELVSSFGTSSNNKNHHHDTNDNGDSHNATTLLTVRSLFFQQSPLEEWHSSSHSLDHSHRLLLQHLHALRRVWWMLVFSALSTAGHVLVLNHVTSTAPSWRDMHPKHQRPRQPQSVYFALRSRRKRHEQVLQRRRQRQAAAGSDPETGRAWDPSLSDDHDDDEEWDDGSDNEEEEPALVHAVNGTRHSQQLCMTFVGCWKKQTFSRIPFMRVSRLLWWPLRFDFFSFILFCFAVDDVCYNRILGGCTRSVASCQARMVQTVG